MITKNQEVCGGQARIRDTRITVWGLVEWRRLGWSDERILQEIPGLTLDDLLDAWAYYAEHPDEIDEAIRLNAEA
jgi:uncharacterized protein (DUF433 family)